VPVEQVDEEHYSIEAEVRDDLLPVPAGLDVWRET
jgi:hypothetical protein